MMTKHDDEFPIPAKCRPKLAGVEFYTKVLGAPKHVVAPMVDQSELAWRLLSRQHGAQLCYSPMFHSSIFCRDPKYRKEALQSCPADRPLIIQFCGNEPQVMLDAAKLAQDHCDAIDINLGCPQAIARRGHYGAFLQDEWKLLAEIVNSLHKHLLVPVTCKIRVFSDMDKTIAYAKMLEAAGAQMLTVHGRTREQKGPFTGLADWRYIRAVKEAVQIPVFANGNILSIEDVNRCLEATHADGVMTAEGNLYNPALFDGVIPRTWDMAREYLAFAEQFPCPTSYMRGHLFKIFHHLLNIPANSVQRMQIAVSHTVDEFRKVVDQLEEKYTPFDNGTQVYNDETSADVADVGDVTDVAATATATTATDYNLTIPPWLCHAYVRLAPEEHLQRIEEKIRISEDPNTVKRQYYDNEGNEVSRKRMKKLRRIYRRPAKEVRQQRGELCEDCQNPAGVKCVFLLCRTCCKNKCFTEEADCEGHGLMVKTKREKARKFQKQTPIVEEA